MKKIALTFVTLLFVSACASSDPQPVRQESDMGPKINLDVLTVVVLDRTIQLGSATPYTTNNFQPTIANAMRRWANEKLVAIGTTGEAIVVLKDASLRSETIPHPDSWFTREQASKYVAHAEIEISVNRRNDHGQVVADTTQFETLPENPTSGEKQNAYNKLLNAVMDDLASNFRGGIKAHLAGFVQAQPVGQ